MGPSQTPFRSVAACALAGSLLACGARSSLEVGGKTTTTSASSSSGGASDDLCPSAVAGPKAMLRSCSTRDGRSRVSAPASPHVTWTTQLPTDATGHLGLSALATDAANHAYVVTTSNFDDVGAVRRLRLADGAMDWTTAITPDSATSTPVVLAHGPVDVFGYGGASQESILELAPETGASTATTFGFDLYYAPPNPAVGADGSLYLVHSTNVGTANTQSFLSRVGPDGTAAWSSADLATLVPPLMNPGSSISPSLVALGRDDLVLVVVDLIASSGDVAQVLAFEPETGAPRWSTPIPGSLLGGPAVRPDGTVAILVSSGGASSLVLLEPEGGAPAQAPLAESAFEIFAVTASGVVIAGSDAGQGIDGLIALASDGTALWHVPGAFREATIAADGTLIAFGPSISALDPATGGVLWELAPPDPGSCIADAALTSAGAIVGLQCSGTVFGASD